MTYVNIKNKYLTLYYQNVQGLNTKLNDFKTTICSSDYDLIVLSETW